MTLLPFQPGHHMKTPLPLSGVKVLDLTHVASGPFCCSMLGQLGADVIKVEPPGTGELMRGTAPFLGSGLISFYFACVNVEKRYVQIDLKTPQGREVLMDLAREADIVVQNMAPGVVDRLGIGYAQMNAVNRRIIYCSISGFRKGSEYQHLPSFDYIHEAMAGVMSMTKMAGEAPPLPGLPAADMSAGVYGVLAVTLALRTREATGVGQEIEIPLQDCLMSLLPARIGYTYATGDPFPSFGRYHVNFAPFGVFDTQDSQIVITVGSEPLWRRLLEVFPDADQQRFATQALRIENMAALYDLLNAGFRERPTDHWVVRLREAGVPVAPILDSRQVVADPYVKEIAQTLDVDGGAYTWHRFPVRFSGFEPRLSNAPKPPGADTEQVLEELGYPEAKRRALRDAKIVEGGGVV